VIAPWQIEPGYSVEEWTQAALALSELPSILKRKKAAEQIFENVRKKNKDYAGLHKRRIH